MINLNSLFYAQFIEAMPSVFFIFYGHIQNKMLKKYVGLTRDNPTCLWDKRAVKNKHAELTKLYVWENRLKYVTHLFKKKQTHTCIH